ncbi:hypothetical protein Emed_003012 [Eimeria media]
MQQQQRKYACVFIASGDQIVVVNDNIVLGLPFEDCLTALRARSSSFRAQHQQQQQQQQQQQREQQMLLEPLQLEVYRGPLPLLYGAKGFDALQRFNAVREMLSANVSKEQQQQQQQQQRLPLRLLQQQLQQQLLLLLVPLQQPSCLPMQLLDLLLHAQRNNPFKCCFFSEFKNAKPEESKEEPAHALIAGPQLLRDQWSTEWTTGQAGSLRAAATLQLQQLLLQLRQRMLLLQQLLLQQLLLQLRQRMLVLLRSPKRIQPHGGALHFGVSACRQEQNS